MSYIESGFLKREEYESNRDGRLMPYELDVDEIFTMLVSLKSAHPNRQAAGFPVFIHDGHPSSETTPPDFSLYAVRFTPLNRQLEPSLDPPVDGTFKDGYWLNPRECGVKVGAGHDMIAIATGYFRKRQGSGTGEQVAITESLQIYDQESELALA